MHQRYASGVRRRERLRSTTARGRPPGRPAALALALLIPLVGCSAEPPPRAPLVHGAHVNHSSTEDTVIRRRILAQFPLGGSEAGLAANLRRQGFEVRRLENVGSTGDQVYGEAKLSWGGLLLGREARIYWRASKHGVLTEVGSTVQVAWRASASFEAARPAPGRAFAWPRPFS